jgi:hypothetical protein
MHISSCPHIRYAATSNLIFLYTSAASANNPPDFTTFSDGYECIRRCTWATPDIVDNPPTHASLEILLRRDRFNPFMLISTQTLTTFGIFERGSFPLGRRRVSTARHYITLLPPSCVRAWTLQPLEYLKEGRFR